MPPKKKKIIRVIKVPLDSPLEYRVAQFPPMPQLYLDLLENKAKVVPQLRNVEYVPKDISISYQSLKEVTSFAESKLLEEDPEFPMNRRSPSARSPRMQGPSSVVDVTSGTEQIINLQPRSDSKRKLVFHESNNADDTIQLNEPDPIRSEPARHFASEGRPSDASRQSEQEVSVDPIVMMLRGDKSSETFSAAPIQQQTAPSQMSGQVPLQQGGPRMNLPPSLSQLNNGNVSMQGGVKDLNGNLKQDEAELSKKRDILFKFRLLKKGYKEANIPDYNEYTELSVLQNEYESFVRQLRIDAKVESYKKYMTFGFSIMEFILINMLNFKDANGYASEQVVNMNDYEKLLIEIGEKSSVEAASQWSPEMRLAGLVLFNTGVFLMSKMVFKVAGDGILNTIDKGGAQRAPGAAGFGGFNFGAMPGASQPVKKTKMKGPEMDMDDVLMNKKNV